MYSQDNSIPSAIAGILQNLSSRPNVESTLILSRSVGTIICATGNLSRNERNGELGRPRTAGLATEATATEPKATETTDSSDAKLEVDGAAVQNNQVLSPAERLAVAVFGFVQSATMLGRAVGGSYHDHDMQDAARTNLFDTVTSQLGNSQYQMEEVENSSKEDQVQLLRLRTKRQEIIIYPDSNYICCVVQSVGKQANGTS